MRYLPALLALLFMLSASALAVTIIVSPDGSGDFPTIRTAIEAAEDGDVIGLTDGVFTGADNHNLRFNGKLLTVRSLSDNPEACVIDCGGGTPDSAQRAFTFYSDDLGVTIRGLTIFNGRAAPA